MRLRNARFGGGGEGVSVAWWRSVGGARARWRWLDSFSHRGLQKGHRRNHRQERSPTGERHARNAFSRFWFLRTRSGRARGRIEAQVQARPCRRGSSIQVGSIVHTVRVTATSSVDRSSSESQTRAHGARLPARRCVRFLAAVRIARIPNEASQHVRGGIIVVASAA